MKVLKQEAECRTIFVFLTPEENGIFAGISETAAKRHASGNEAAPVSVKVGDIGEISDVAADTENCFRQGGGSRYIVCPDR